jgi:hypothetical protein
MTVPYYVNEHQSDIRAIKPGWYGLERSSKLSSGPFLNRGNASPVSFAHRPGCGGPLSVPCVEASTSVRALA